MSTRNELPGALADSATRRYHEQARQRGADVAQVPSIGELFAAQSTPELEMRTAFRIGAARHCLAARTRGAGRAASPAPLHIRLEIRSGGVRHRTPQPPTLEEQFRWASESGRLAYPGGTLDHSHLIVDIDNPRNSTGRHAPLQDLPSFLRRRDRPTRGGQYSFVAPGQGERPAVRSATAMESGKTVSRKRLAHHRALAASARRLISLEFVPFVDYGGGSHYSLYENSTARDRWVLQPLDGPVPSPAVSAVDPQPR